VDVTIRNQLLTINLQFYQTFADSFSATRHRIQPGVRRILGGIPLTHKILDVGCGNGNLRVELFRRGFLGEYVGLDFSPPLLEHAKNSANDELLKNNILNPPSFLLIDLTKSGWDRQIPNPPFEFVMAFSVLHHIPGTEMRGDVLKQVRSLIAPEGRLAISAWQFLSSKRLLSRIQDWSTIGLDAAQVDQGDFLLDWRSGGQGLRYVHHITEQEFAELAAQSGFSVLESFYMDGEGARLGLYQIWKPVI
jgi:2-polyprenyl-3-methyl-5-hydroxy-6-metoxy-1,4-benzoquinol methylase